VRFSQYTGNAKSVYGKLPHPESTQVMSGCTSDPNENYLHPIDEEGWTQYAFRRHFGNLLLSNKEKVRVAVFDVEGNVEGDS
jgi:hypothetical protein